MRINYAMLDVKPDRVAGCRHLSLIGRMLMPAFTPHPVQVVDSPQQLKAFTDPLRIRILVALAERAVTNQQLADMLGAPQANVLYHLRFLLKVGLILLIDLGQRLIGLGVDDVRDLHDIPENLFFDAPQDEANGTNCVTASVEIEGERVSVVDIRSVARQVIGQGR